MTFHPATGQVLITDITAVDEIEAVAINPDMRLRKGRVTEIGPLPGMEGGAPFEEGDHVYFVAEAPLIQFSGGLHQVGFASIITWAD